MENSTISSTKKKLNFGISMKFPNFDFHILEIMKKTLGQNEIPKFESQNKILANSQMIWKEILINVKISVFFSGKDQIRWLDWRQHTSPKLKITSPV